MLVVKQAASLINLYSVVFFYIFDINQIYSKDGVMHLGEDIVDISIVG